MKVGLQTNINYQTLVSAQKMLEQAVKLPQQLTGEISKLQGKLIKVNTVVKLQSSKVDTYA